LRTAAQNVGIGTMRCIFQHRLSMFDANAQNWRGQEFTECYKRFFLQRKFLTHATVTMTNVSDCTTYSSCQQADIENCNYW